MIFDWVRGRFTFSGKGSSPSFFVVINLRWHQLGGRGWEDERGVNRITMGVNEVSDISTTASRLKSSLPQFSASPSSLPPPPTHNDLQSALCSVSVSLGPKVWATRRSITVNSGCLHSPKWNERVKSGIWWGWICCIFACQGWQRESWIGGRGFK